MARHDTDWNKAEAIERAAVLRAAPLSERSALVRLLTGGAGWEQASRELRGAFAEPPSTTFTQGRKE